MQPRIRWTVNGQRVAASIGIAGGRNLFDFVVAEDGVHVVETGGSTDVVMQLVGPDSITTLVAEENDGGASVNARIVRNLISGTYAVRVRHDQGTGQRHYTVSVRR